MGWGIFWRELGSFFRDIDTALLRSGRWQPRRALVSPGALRRLGVGLVAWCFLSPAFAAKTSIRFDPTYVIDTWETEEGLPENSATAMVQTPDGYLWFGTFKGLVRYNGVQFEVLNLANTPALPSDGIVNLHSDRSGRLWVSTYEGMAVLESGQWRRLRKDDGWAGDYARTFAERSNGDLLVTAFNGKVFEFSRGAFTELPPPPGDPGRGYFGCSDEEGRWWVVQNRFVGLWDGGKWVERISLPDVPPEAVGCTRARDGGMWLALGNELRKLRHGAEVARVRLPERPGGVWSLSEDSKGNVWIATHDRGICRVATDGGMVRWSATNGWSDHGRFVFEDRESNLWVGTTGDGLMRFKPRRFLGIGRESGLQETVVRSVWPDADSVWVGTYGRGVFRWSDAGVTNVPQIPNSYVQSVLVDRAGRSWIGTFGESLWLLEKQGARHLSSDQTGGNNVIALFEDSLGRVWISGSEAIAMFDGSGFRGFGTNQGLPLSAVVGFAEDNRGAIWVSNESGVFRREQDRFVEVRAERR
jgi:ligand-binding sensor domain-containing protein